MSLEFDFGAVLKFGSWAGSLPETIDFTDYWYNLFLSETKAMIESSPMNKINAFHWTRWQEDFEREYIPVAGDSDTSATEDYEVISRSREWFACYMQYLVYALQMPSKVIARFYGKEVFISVMSGWRRYHTFGVDHFVAVFADKYGLPAGCHIMELNM